MKCNKIPCGRIATDNSTKYYDSFASLQTTNFKSQTVITWNLILVRRSRWRNAPMPLLNAGGHLLQTFCNVTVVRLIHWIIISIRFLFLYMFDWLMREPSLLVPVLICVWQIVLLFGPCPAGADGTTPIIYLIFTIKFEPSPLPFTKLAAFYCCRPIA